MISIQKHIGQPIISLESKKIIGTTKGIQIKNNKVANFCAFCDEQDIEFIFPTSAILAVGDDAIVIKHEKNIHIQEDIGTSRILGLPIYNQQGKILGIVKDLEVDDNFKLINILYKNTKIDFSSIDEINSYLILLKGPYKLKKHKVLNTKFNYLVNIERNDINLPASVPIITQTEQKQPEIPNRTTANLSNLLGKTLTRDIDYKGKHILKAGTQITQKVLDLGKISGTLKDIALHTI